MRPRRSGIRGSQRRRPRPCLPARPSRAASIAAAFAAFAACAVGAAGPEPASDEHLGREVAVPVHLQDGEEFRLPLVDLVEHGRRLFEARWTSQEGAGRPLSKGTGTPLSDGSDPLRFPRNFNRISGPDANSCAGCHNQPYGVAGGSGDVVTNVFVLAQRFDFVDFSDLEQGLTTSSRDETGRGVTLETVGNARATVGMFGSGYIEMLAREMTIDLQRIRDELAPGESVQLKTKGVSFGELRRILDGRWDTADVVGLSEKSLATWGSDDAPSLIVAPFHQSGSVVSLREFTNRALNQHHGIQSAEWFGSGNDPDADGVIDEVTRADLTALCVYQATLPVPGRVIPSDRPTEHAVLEGERVFASIGCAGCHVPRLPLGGEGHLYVEPNPFNEEPSLQTGDAPPLVVDLNAKTLPPPRLRSEGGVTWVPAYTDLRLHDISSAEDDPNREPLDLNQRPGSSAFFAGNSRFLTRSLWGSANQPPYFHHGKFTTLREAVLAHDGEARPQKEAFLALEATERDSLIEFLKTLRVLPPGTRSQVVDEFGRPRAWPPAAGVDGASGRVTSFRRRGED